MVQYWLDLFTPRTWEEAQRNNFKLSGFRENRWGLVQKIEPGDILICYITRISRFSGLLKVDSKPYKNAKKARKVWKEDSFPCVMDVEPLLTLDFLHSIPASEVISKLTIAAKWGGIVRGSPKRINNVDGDTIKKILINPQRIGFKIATQMHSINKKYSRFQEDTIFIQKFLSRDGQELGIRLATPDDAITISMIFKEVYGYQYVKPFVYNIELLKRELIRKNSFWFVGEVLENKEIMGTGLIEKNRYIAHAGSMAIKKKFQGIGVAAKMGTAAIISITKIPLFKDVLRLDGEAEPTVDPPDCVDGTRSTDLREGQYRRRIVPMAPLCNSRRGPGGARRPLH